MQVKETAEAREALTLGDALKELTAKKEAGDKLAQVNISKIL